MDHGKYQLEIAYRKMEEFQQQAERRKLIEELKTSDPGYSSWWKVIATTLFQPGQLLLKTMFRPLITRQSTAFTRDKK